MQNDPRQSFGKYELLERLEEGVTGTVYRARDSETGRNVVLKLVAGTVSANPHFGRYFYDKWANRDTVLEHPNVIQILEVGKEDETYFVALEQTPGRSLTALLRETPLEPEEALDIIRQTAEALRAAHRAGTVHGDLKPSDIILSSDRLGRRLIKVAFFDIAVAAAESMVSAYGEMLGTPKYMAPEVIRGRAPDTQSDIFALGVISYEVLTGKEPFPSSHSVGYLFANCEGELVPPHEVSASVPRDLSAIVCRMLEKDPARRYENAQNLIDDLDRAQHSIRAGRLQAVPAGTDSAFAKEHDLPKARNPRPISAAQVLALVLGIVAVAGLVAGAFVIGLRWQMSETVAYHAPGSPFSAERFEGPGPPLVVPARQEPPLPTPEPAEPRPQDTDAKALFENAQKEGEHFSRTGDYETAVITFTKAARSCAGSAYAEKAYEMAARAYDDWAQALLRDHQYEPAVKKLELAVQLAPPGRECHALLAGKLAPTLARWADHSRAKGDYEEALSIYGRIAEEFPRSPQAALLDKMKPRLLFRQGYSLWKEKGRMQEGAAKLRQVLAEYPKTNWAAKAGEALPGIALETAREMLEKQPEAALQSLRKLMEEFPESEAAKSASALKPALLRRLHDAALTKKDLDAAAEHFRELCAQYPGSSHAILATRSALGLTPIPGKAALKPGAVRARVQQSDYYCARMRYRAAVAALKTVVPSLPPESELAPQAIEKLREATYLCAIYDYGAGKADKAHAQLKDVAGHYAYVEWSQKARRALDRIENPPQGMLYVPEGRFMMGSDLADLRELLEPLQPKGVPFDDGKLKLVAGIHGLLSETPQHVAETGAFFIDAKEVTNAEYKKFAEATGRRPPAQWLNGAYTEEEANKPVTNVTFADAAAYAEWVGKTLPTEAQWEKAARGTEHPVYPWGDTFRTDHCHHMVAREAGAKTVGSCPAGASPYGALDMIGNVMEWTCTWFNPYPGQKEGNTKYGTTHKVIRGGAWFRMELGPIPARCASRYAMEPEAQNLALGFRCVKEP